MDTNNISNTFQNYYDYIKFNPILLTVLIIILVLYFIMFSSLGSSENDNSFEANSDSNSDSGLFNILGIVIAIILIIVLIIYGSQYFLNVDIIGNIKNYFTQKHEVNVVLNEASTTASDVSGNTPIDEIDYIDQVYHIPGNIYTYNDAQALCSAYGNKIANYSQIESAYNDGADWCSYGWSDNQMAFFPTQSSTWENLQKMKGHENDCGRPGINGGYIDSPNVKFGVNCYGHKPKITPLEATLMTNQTLYPTTENEQAFNDSVSYWQQKLDSILVAPFNSDKWSKGLNPF